MDTFAWRFLTIAVDASIDDAGLQVKQGIRTWRVALADLRHLYVRRTGQGQYDEMIVGAEVSGKKKVFRFSGEAGHPGFAAFTQAVLARRPDIDRRAMPEKDALKLIGAKNVELITGVVTFAIILGIVMVALLPKLIHGLDGGHEKVKISKLVKGYSPGTSNLTITDARVDTSHALSLTTVSKRNGIETGRSTKFYIPLVDKDADDDDPIKVIIETKQLSNSEMSELEDSDAIKGIVRDTLWEGLGSSQRDYFIEKAHRKLAKNVLLLEYKAEARDDLVLFGVATGVTTFILLVIGVVIVVKAR